MKLQGKKAIVTGGTSGIGLAAAQLLAERGANVSVISRSGGPLPSELSGVANLVCDVRDRPKLQELFEQHGPIDILVCAATGGKRAAGPFLEMDLDGYQGSFDKLWGYTNCVRLAGPQLSDEAAIVLVSGAPARRARQGQSALASVGGAVEAFCRSVAPEIAPRRINVVSPGFVATRMFGETESERMEKLGPAVAGHTIPRPGRPREVGEAILFLVENDFVTGTTVDVDGGWLLS